MKNKQELLAYIIENNIFEHSWSALARRINYTNRSLPYRLKKGSVKESTAENILDRICQYFEMSWNELIDIVDEMIKGKVLYDIIKSENPYNNTVGYEDKILTDFVKLDFKNYSDNFKEQHEPYIMEIRRENPTVFYGMVMILYIKLKKTNPYIGNHENFHKFLKDFTVHIVDELRLAFPESNTGYYASLAYISDNIIKDAPQCIWGMTLYNIHVLRYFSDPDYLNQMLLTGTVFPEWDYFSYWHKSGASYRKGEKIWTMLKRESDSSLHGMYIGQAFEIGNDNETFIPQESFSIIFWNKEDDDDEALIQINNIISSENDTYILYYGTYSYNKESDEIFITWDNDEENVLNMPTRMKRVCMDKPSEKEEQIWSNIIRRFDENGSFEKVNNSYTEKTNIQYLFDEYEIQDVNINRRELTISVIHDENTEYYCIPIDAYPFLKELNVFDDICIKKNIITNKLYVEWVMKGYHIPLSEFSIESDYFLTSTHV